MSAVSRPLCPCACRGFLFRLHSCTLPLHKRILSAVSASGEEREGGREAGANRVKRMPHATQACNRAAVVMTLIAPHAKSASDQEQRLRGLSASQEMAERGNTSFLQRFAALTVCRRGG